jgi:RsiW-degrading membrane proteinase PrsW (M82 family)
LRWVLSCFFLGATVVPLPTLLVSTAFAAILGEDSPLFYSVAVPILEEAFKIIPLLVLLILPRWRYRWTASATDLLILGAALGAGFDFYETTLNSLASNWSASTVLDMHDILHLGPIYPFPNLEVKTFGGIGLARISGTLAAFIGHGGATAFIALVIGWVRLVGAWLKGKLGVIWLILWIVPLIVWGWMVFDHGMYNYTVDTADLPLLLRVPYTLGIYGRLSTFILYLLILATIGLERLLLWWGSWRMVGLRLSKDRLMLLKGNPNLLSIPLHLLALRNFLRERRGLSCGLHFYHRSGGQNEKLQTYLENLAQALLFWKSRIELAPSSTGEPQSDADPTEESS